MSIINNPEFSDSSYKDIVLQEDNIINQLTAVAMAAMSNAKTGTIIPIDSSSSTPRSYQGSTFSPSSTPRSDQGVLFVSYAVTPRSDSGADPEEDAVVPKKKISTSEAIDSDSQKVSPANNPIRSPNSGSQLPLKRLQRRAWNRDLFRQPNPDVSPEIPASRTGSPSLPELLNSDNVNVSNTKVSEE